ncbi:MAG: CotH kinase family protein [Alphaproteobacteria bacterium]|nr:CotH kinase family protein [Alphaproteobacteria bacterium]
MWLLLLACTPASVKLSDDSAPAPGDDSGAAVDRVYDTSHLLQVDITLPEADWDALRAQQRTTLELLAGEDCLEDNFPNPYTWFEAEVRLDGTLLERVGLRKKGLVGSNDPFRPSLKLDFDRFVDDGEWEGVSRLTLNNGRQDPSRMQACMAYAVFRDAGLPAPRCSFAEVHVNGQALGVYANVEPIKDPFLRRWFEDDAGALYEGTLSDFREGWTGTFEDKHELGDLEAIEAVIAALEAPDAELAEALDSVLDLDQYLRFWAAEVLVGHWDGYAGNTNNFYIYADPADGRLRFIPWGADAVFQGPDMFGQGAPRSVVAHAALPARLVEVPALRAAYFDALRALLDEAWDEDLLQQRYDDWRELIRPGLLYYEGPEAYAASLSGIEDFIHDRRGALERELSGPAPEGVGQLYDNRCLLDLGDLVLDFETTWGSYGSQPTFSTGSGSWSLIVRDEPVPVAFLGAVVGEYEPGAGILFVSGQLEGGANIGFYGLFDTPTLSAPGTVAADWREMTTYLLLDADGDYQDWQVNAYLGEGGVRLEESGTQRGAPVRGQVAVEVFGQ